jgi:hypothetical protein
MEAEGWYYDPYGLHEERWYSDGTPTKLVRDAHVESFDAPPSEPAGTAELVRSAREPSGTGPEEYEDDAMKYSDAAFGEFGQYRPRDESGRFRH